jgi:hypothetical protein
MDELAACRLVFRVWGWHGLKPVKRGRWLRSILGRSDRPRDFREPDKVLRVLSLHGRPDEGGEEGRRDSREGEKAHKSLAA